jgi:hypothetical protein
MPKAAKPKKPRARRTLVPHRSRLPIGDEAQIVAAALRALGADPGLVPRPGIDSDQARKDWIAGRSRPARRAQMWVLDYAAAILEMIPATRHRALSKDRQLTEWVRNFSEDGSPIMDSARLVATLEANRVAAETGKPIDPDATKKLAARLARRRYRKSRRKGDVPKSGE